MWVMSAQTLCQTTFIVWYNKLWGSQSNTSATNRNISMRFPLITHAFFPNGKIHGAIKKEGLFLTE